MRVRTSMSRWFFAAVLTMFGAVAGAPSSSAAEIESGGPLTSIDISPVLNCDVRYEGDVMGEWYDDIACGTFVAFDDRLFGPERVPAGGDATLVDNYEPFTAVSQSGPTGAGTSASPYTVTTTVGLGDTGATLTQVDTYVAGATAYRTDIRITGGATTGDAVVFRGGDCYLQDSDFGLGQVLDGNSPVCKAQPDSVNPERVEGMRPLSSGAAYIEAGYNQVWEAIGRGEMLPNTCRCDERIDNGIAISWTREISQGATVTLSSLTFFSPVGTTPLTVSKTVDQSEVSAGSEVTYTIRVSNPGATSQVVSSVTDSLPAGFTYVPGSTTGATTNDPTGTTDLTWTDDIEVPAATGDTPGSVSLSFRATVSDVAGTYTNTASATGEGVTVVAAEDTAPVTVTAASPTTATSTTSTSTSTTSSSSTSTSTTSTSTSSTPTSTTTSDPTATTSQPTSTTTGGPTATVSGGPETPDVVQTDGGPMDSASGGALVVLAGAAGLGLLLALRWSVMRPSRRH
ncbi:DUF11 domain-containing protein [Janibacter hoylei PVAS-1]|uniref:DUF11 domain-containing protein n=2 Tax=Janibacter hoylei PVAS-1 TaxID=1210046 RepID=A0A444B8J2_9MICO|nr:DUF11 domain-containing protein [Janibacter hoylei]RWU84738.1 DUF11 domain-containing protein [Janibacter hoylei PVAS-1]